MEVKPHLVGRGSCGGEKCRVTVNSIITLYEIAYEDFCVQRGGFDGLFKSKEGDKQNVVSIFQRLLHVTSHIHIFQR